jgi:DNA-directed RNA polymerase specialized sigma24 family protein
MLRTHGREIAGSEGVAEVAGGMSMDWDDECVVRDELARALACLSDRQRLAVTLRYIHDLDEATTASRLGTSVANVRAAAHEGRARLRQLLAEHAA